MKKLIYSIVVVILSATYTNAQQFTNEFGANGIVSMMNTNYGFVPGLGFEFDHRLNFVQGHFTLKNSLGMTSYAMQAYDVDDFSGGRKKGQDYLWMLDVMGEYNFVSYKDFHRKSHNSWTPYVGLGVNFIYRSTKSFSHIQGSDGFYATLKGSLGVKYKLSSNLLLNIEGNFDWDFSDELDGYKLPEHKWYNYDHMASLSIGFTYLFRTSPGGTRNFWSGL